jgi:hypothetical protein
MRHRRGHRLVDLWEALSAAWGAVTSGRAWKAEQDRYGVLGWVRTVEATHGPAGWHLHIHALVVFDAPTSVEMAGEMAGRMFGRWSRALARRGLEAVEDKGGLDCRMVAMTGESIERVAEYLSKITHEITSPTTKDARGGNRSPFAILRDALSTGLAEDCELWLTWERASHGRKQLTWSRDLRSWAGLHVERTDDEIVAEDDLHGEDVLIVSNESWKLVRVEVSDLLDAVEIGGVAAAIRWLDSRGCRWSRPRPRGGGVPPSGPTGHRGTSQSHNSRLPSGGYPTLWTVVCGQTAVSWRCGSGAWRWLIMCSGPGAGIALGPVRVFTRRHRRTARSRRRRHPGRAVPPAFGHRPRVDGTEPTAGPGVRSKPYAHARRDGLARRV